MSIAAVILILLTDRAKSNGLAFLGGWISGLAIVGGFMLVVSNVAGLSTTSGNEESTIGALIKLLLGLLLFGKAYQDWRNRSSKGEKREMPAWIESFEGITTGKCLGLGALMGIRPKNLALTLAAALTIAQAGFEPEGQIFILCVFIIIASITVIVPVLFFLVSGEKAEGTLDDWNAWLIDNHAAIMIVLFVIFGAILIGSGISELAI
jgi:heme/copper-type cytochrome/quinol oxidase subunit 4